MNPNAAPASPSQSTQPISDVKPLVPAAVATTEAASAPMPATAAKDSATPPKTKSQSPSGPLVAVTIAIILFAGLVAMAYLAYSHSA